MTDPIRIHHADTDDEAKARHDNVIARLTELGLEEVRAMRDRDELPQAWAPIIRAWLKDPEAAKAKPAQKGPHDGHD